jgi:hypothetical protein
MQDKPKPKPQPSPKPKPQPPPNPKTTKSPNVIHERGPFTRPEPPKR